MRVFIKRCKDMCDIEAIKIWYDIGGVYSVHIKGGGGSLRNVLNNRPRQKARKQNLL